MGHERTDGADSGQLEVNSFVAEWPKYCAFCGSTTLRRMSRKRQLAEGVGLGSNILHLGRHCCIRLNQSDPPPDRRHSRLRGNFFGAERSEWDPETLQEGRYDAANTMRPFEEANATEPGDTYAIRNLA